MSDLIAQHRKGGLSISVIDANGNAAPGPAIAAGFQGHVVE